MPEFLKFWNIWWNRLKLSTNDRFNIRCWKNLVWSWHLWCSSVSKVSKIFTHIPFKGLLCINCLHSESHHIASKSFETFHTPPNDEVLMIKLSLGHCWFTGEIFLQLTCGSNINYFLLCAWISEIWKYLMKSLETFHKWPIQYSLLKKLSLELAPIMLVLFQSLQDLTYVAFKGLLCIYCLHSESHHIASKSFETFHFTHRRMMRF